MVPFSALYTYRTFLCGIMGVERNLIVHGQIMILYNGHEARNNNYSYIQN